MNYKDLIIQVKSYSCKLFLFNQLYQLNNWKNFKDDIQLPIIFIISEINFYIA